MFLCIEILGESAYHKFLVQAGWSGRDYVFNYNALTGSHMRAYRCLEDYYAERVDLHKSSNVWPLLANYLPAESIEPQVFVEFSTGRAVPDCESVAVPVSEPVVPAKVGRPRGRPRKARVNESCEPTGLSSVGEESSGGDGKGSVVLN